MKSKDFFLHTPTIKIYECMGTDEGYVWYEGEEIELQKFDQGDCEKIPEIFEPAILLLEKEIHNWKDIAESNAYANKLACGTVYELRERNNELLSVLKEAKEVLVQLDHRHNGKCYNPLETDCNCTLCKINSVIQKATA